jgi:CubicO group peptidase (beta-lactamase class C family)
VSSVRDVLAQLSPYLEAEIAAFTLEAGVPGVAAAAVLGGDATWSSACGTADVTSGRRLEPDTPMRVGSLTKPFTAAAILRLRDEGALSLEDPVVDHLPEFARIRTPRGVSVRDVRVVHLVTHRAGLRGEVHALDDASEAYPAIDEILAALADVSLLFAPGTAMRYSNLGYQLLGEIVARRAGCSYEAFCARSFFSPLGLSTTRFDTPEGAARGYRARAFTDRVEPAPDRRKRTNADGGLWSTAPDQARWIRAQLGVARGVPDLTVMHGPLEGSDDDGSAGQGIGWFRERRVARTLVYHQGSTPGFGARIAFAPGIGGAVVLANGEAPTKELLGTIVDLLLDGADGVVPLDPPPPVPTLPGAAAYPRRWDELVGFYAWPGSAMLFRLEVRSGQLRLIDVDADAVIPLAPDDEEDAFVAMDGGWAGERVMIRRDGDGTVRGLRLGAWSVARLVEAGT